MTPMLGNISAILILAAGFAILFVIEKVVDRRNLNKYLPNQTHKGATRRVITARRKP